MNKSFQEPVEDLPDEDIAAQLLVSCDSEGNISYECDWGDDPNAVAIILYKMLEGSLGSDILKHLSSQCVLHDKSEDYQLIQSFISDRFMKEHKEDDNEVVVSPTNATRLS